MTIANLFARIGIKADDKQANNFLKSIKNIKVGMVAAAAGATVLAGKLKNITEEAFETARALQQMNAETGVNTDELQRWQAVADQTNNAAQSVTSSIKAIVANQEKIKLGQGDISGFQLLGIDPQQDPFKILEELRTKTRGLSEGMKKNILAQVGVSSDLIQALNLSNEEFEKMASRAYIIPQSAIKNIDNARKSFRQFGQMLNYAKTMLVAKISPALNTAMKWIQKFGKAVFSVSRMIDELVRNTIGWDKVLVGVIALVTILNAKLLASPIGLFIAGIVLLIAILEDLYAFSKGKRSLFGELLEGDIVDRITEKWKVFGEVLRNVVDAMKFLLGHQDKIDTSKKGIFEKIPGYDKLVDLVSGAYVGIKPGPRMNQGTTRNTTNNYKINQNITANGDPQQNADMIDKKIQDTINSANSQIGGDE